MNPYPALDGIETRMAILLSERVTAPYTATVHDDPDDAIMAVEHQALTANEGGKRLRAMMAMAAYHAFVLPGEDTKSKRSDADDDAMLDIACAIEIYQTSALIHDDIIDESSMRRGRPSAHVALASYADDRRRGMGLALMLGNMLATASADIASDAFRRLHVGAAGTQAFLDMQRAVQIGQVLDLSLERMPLSRFKDCIPTILDVYRWKTASYTTMAPIELGALAAGAEPGMAQRIAEAIGLPLGLAFQLHDDLLDVTGTTSDTGKPVGGDIREGKRTVLLSDALRMAEPKTRASLIAVFTKERRDQHDVDAVIRAYDRTGALQASRERIGALVARTLTALASSDLSQRQQHCLYEACSHFIPGTDLS